MISQLLAHIQPGQFDLSTDNFTQLDQRTIVVTRWNWEYTQALAFQRQCVRLMPELPQLRVLICCNHPRVLTHGRGLQRPRPGEALGLTEFKPDDHPTLPFPLYKIERGGGLTFHHPGQFIFYPIVKLNPKTLSLSMMIDGIFSMTEAVLNNWGMANLHHGHQLLGLWAGDKKLASMGIAIERLTTFHGMALNLYRDDAMCAAMKTLSPCGISSEIYSSVEEQISLPRNALENFTRQFLERIKDGWQ